MSSITDKVWITGRIRMVTEARLRRRAHLWNFLIVWYTVGLTCLSVYQLISENDASRNLASTVLSILVLSLTIFIPTLGFERKADQFRECYLRLQRLLDNTIDAVHLSNEYHDILERFPNHPSRDWHSLLVTSKMAERPIENDGNTVPVPCQMIVKHYAWNTAEGISWMAAFSIPFALYLWLLR